MAVDLNIYAHPITEKVGKYYLTPKAIIVVYDQSSSNVS